MQFTPILGDVIPQAFDSMRYGNGIKQLLAIMLVFTVAIVLTLGRGMAPRCAVA
jgi:hypothetical protein